MTKTKGATKAKAATRAGTKAKTKAKPPSKRGKAGKAASEAPAPTTATTASGRHRWKGMSIEDLQALYTETVGRRTDSSERGYLTWKIREAEAGRVPVGPRKDQIEGPKVAVTILFGTDTLAAIDAVAKEDGFPKRLAYLRDAIRRGLEMRGHAKVAALIPG